MFFLVYANNLASTVYSPWSFFLLGYSKPGPYYYFRRPIYSIDGQHLMDGKPLFFPGTTLVLNNV